MTYILATDEAGYGTLAGDLVVAGVLAPLDWVPPRGVKDSKKLSRDDLEGFYRVLLADHRIRHFIHRTPPEEIDRAGAYQALRTAHQAVHQQLGEKAQGVVKHIADGNLELGNGRHLTLPTNRG